MTNDEFKDMEARLVNWRLCLRVGIIRHHCGSAEHLYRPPKGEALESRRAPQLVIDDDDGQTVERAWRLLALQYRWMLKLHYALQLQPRGVIRWVLKRAGYAVKPWHFKAELHHAVSLLKKVLDNDMQAAENRRHNLIAVSQDAWNESPKAALVRPEKINEPAEA